MTTQEGVLLGCCLATLALVARIWLTARWRSACLITLACLPAVYLALEHGSQFTTVDERRILRQLLAWGADSPVREWNAGALRTSVALLAPVCKLIQWGAPNWDLVTRLALLKNVHWYLGFVLFLWIGRLAQRALALERNLLHWLLLCYGVLLLPVHLMALKILNYDQFALHFSLISLLAIVIALREDRLSFAYLSVACGYLGAQEKLSASPFLLVAMILLAYLLLRRGRPVRAVIQAALAPPAVCLALGGATTLVALATRSFDTARFRYVWLDIVDPLISWVWVVQRFVGGGRDFAAYRWVHLGVVIVT